MNARSFSSRESAASLRRRSRTLLSLTGMLGVGLLVAACSSSPAVDPSPEESSETLTTVDVAFAPVADFAPVFIAIEKGYFEEEGLDVQTQTGQNAAAVVPSILNGFLDFSGIAVPPFLKAIEQELPVQAVANVGSVSPDPETDSSGITVMPDSGISRAKDLEGHTIAVNQLGSLSHVTAAGAINADGGDFEKATFVAMPFPDMVAALERGTIDAAAVIEPFLAQSTAVGAEVISSPNSATLLPDGSSVIIFSSQAFVAENPEIVEKFTRALDRGTADAIADPELVGEILHEYANLDPELFSQMVYPNFSDDLSLEAIEHAAQVMVDLQLLNSSPDLTNALWSRP